ncbi:unnamed protein product [Parnassius apollo]|uniref:(apollo) hypothetical protein n=1 Tax=Parnassius apollo TaxID=110799 RepID=A0A8S3XI39_PARAO|nr:unnamed protein product [Parnassius apollo]
MVIASISEESGSEYSPSESSNSSVEPIDGVCQREPSKRIRKPPVYYHCQNVHTEQCKLVAYGDAMMRSDSIKWKEAIDREMQTPEEFNT